MRKRIAPNDGNGNPLPRKHEADLGYVRYHERTDGNGNLLKPEDAEARLVDSMTDGNGNDFGAKHALPKTEAAGGGPKYSADYQAWLDGGRKGAAPKQEAQVGLPQPDGGKPDKGKGAKGNEGKVG